MAERSLSWKDVYRSAQEATIRYMRWRETCLCKGGSPYKGFVFTIEFFVKGRGSLHEGGALCQKGQLAQDFSGVSLQGVVLKNIDGSEERLAFMIDTSLTKGLCLCKVWNDTLGWAAIDSKIAEGQLGNGPPLIQKYRMTILDGLQMLRNNRMATMDGLPLIPQNGLVKMCGMWTKGLCFVKGCLLMKGLS
eukprot:4622573-Amphidinium_carterae.1